MCGCCTYSKATHLVEWESVNCCRENIAKKALKGWVCGSGRHRDTESVVVSGGECEEVEEKEEETDQRRE